MARELTRDGFDRVVRETDGLGHHTDTAYNANSIPVNTKRVDSAVAVLTQTDLAIDERERGYRVGRFLRDAAVTANDSPPGPFRYPTPL